MKKKYINECTECHEPTLFKVPETFICAECLELNRKLYIMNGAYISYEATATANLSITESVRIDPSEMHNILTDGNIDMVKLKKYMEDDDNFDHSNWEQDDIDDISVDIHSIMPFVEKKHYGKDKDNS